MRLRTKRTAIAIATKTNMIKKMITKVGPTVIRSGEVSDVTQARSRPPKTTNIAPTMIVMIRL